jgi:hypothetical protein
MTTPIIIGTSLLIVLLGIVGVVCVRKKGGAAPSLEDSWLRLRDESNHSDHFIATLMASEKGLETMQVRAEVPRCWTALQ